MSMSMFSQHTGAPNGEHYSIGIKNTFVHIPDEVAHTVSRRRSSSAPPAMHIAIPEVNCDTPRSKLQLDVDDSCGSTNDQDNDTCVSDTDTNTDDLSPSPCTISIAPMSPRRTPLNRATKAWSPSQAGAVSLGALPVDLRHRFSRTIVQAKEAFAACLLIHRTALMENGGVWSLVGYCRPQHRNYAQILLSQAKMGLVAAADNSNDVFVIGNDGNTFMLAHGQVGMNVQLALVQDKKTACWDVLTKGFCPRGRECRWLHPLWKAPLSIAIAFET